MSTGPRRARWLCSLREFDEYLHGPNEPCNGASHDSQRLRLVVEIRFGEVIPHNVLIGKDSVLKHIGWLHEHGPLQVNRVVYSSRILFRCWNTLTGAGWENAVYRRLSSH